MFCAGGDHSDLASLRVIKTIQPRENRPSPNPAKRARNLLGDVETGNGVSGTTVALFQRCLNMEKNTKGPDNPTCQLHPISTKQRRKWDGAGRKDKGDGGRQIV